MFTTALSGLKHYEVYRKLTMTSISKGGGDDQSFTHLDLSGKLIIKAQLGDDIRRMSIHNEALTYDELVLMMQRVFRGKLSSSDDILIKYKDEDGDLITIFDSSDLVYAVQYSHILKLQIFVGGEAAQRSRGLLPAQVTTIRRELQTIRDQVNRLLDTIEPRNVEVSSSTGDLRHGAPELNNAAPNVSSREFDPLQDQSSQQKADPAQTGMKEELQPTEDTVPEVGRGNTPDSLGSGGSRRVSSGFEAQPQPGYQPVPTSQPTQQQQVYQSAEQQPQPAGQPQQAYQPQGYTRFAVPFVGTSVMPQQGQMIVQATGQQPVPQNAFPATYRPYQSYAVPPQAAGGPPSGYQQPTPTQPQPQPQTYQQDFSNQQRAFMPTGFPPQQAGVGSNPYSKGSGYTRPPSQTGYQ